MNNHVLPQNVKAEGILVFTTLIWGLTFVVIKQGLNDASAFMFLFLRFGAASVCYLIIFRKHFKGLSRKTILRSVLLGLFFFCGYAMQTLGLEYTTVAKSALITYLFAVMVPPLQFFLTGKKPKLINIAALAIVFSGMYMFTAPGSSSLNRGDFLTFFGAVGYAFYIVFIDRYTGKEDPVVLTGFQFFVSTVLALLMSLMFETIVFKPTLNLLGSVLYLSIPGSVIAILLVNKFQGMSTPVRVCVIYALEPVFSIIFGWIILSENLSVNELTGSLLIIAGVVFTEVYGLFKRKPAKDETSPVNE